MTVTSVVAILVQLEKATQSYLKYDYVSVLAITNFSATFRLNG
ncbi:MAG TPA: hypothetical protein VFI43_02965 [Nitrosospira sp.]|nr:hypothetical protein [Nitrosospira sp.]